VGEIAKVLREKEDSRALFHTKVTAPGAPTQPRGGAVIQDQAGHGPPKRRLSLQMHHHRSEHWVVVTGCAEVTIGDATYLLRNGESTFVPAGTATGSQTPVSCRSS